MDKKSKIINLFIIYLYLISTSSQQVARTMKETQKENASTETIETPSCWSVDIDYKLFKVLTLRFPFSLLANDVAINVLAARTHKISLAEIFAAKMPTHPGNRRGHAVPRA